MRRKITLQFIIMTLVSIIFTALISVYVFYGVVEKEVLLDLANYSEILSGIYPLNEQIDVPEELRVTIVSPDGSAVYDSGADADGMESLPERSEIAQAFEKGSAEAIRKSNTPGKSVFYYALRMENGYVIQVAKEVRSMLALILSALPVLLVFCAAVFLVCASMTKVLTDSILQPILKIAVDPDNMIASKTYPELFPIAQTIQNQHHMIRKDTQIRQEFTANVTHELKTPLAAIAGYSELIASGMAEADEVTKYARDISRNSDRLLTLINDVLRLSELDSTSPSQSKMSVVNLAEETRKCVEMIRVGSRRQDVTIEEHISKDVDTRIRSDSLMLNELIYNLCDNAIRYNNPDGRVDVTVRKGDGTVILEVKDTGIGIPESDQERIFERFFRVDKSRSKATGGTGLGLAIVKHIVERHEGAKLEMKSRIGEGTVIWVSFPELPEDEKNAS